VGRADAAAARRFFAAHADRGSVIGAPGTDLIWAGGRLVDAWPANPDENEYGRVRNSKVETLLVGGRLDFATPPQWAARELLPHLPNGRQVVISNIGHTDDFWAYQPKASSRLINTYLDSGRVDTSAYTDKPVDFTPSVSHGDIAKIVLGSMLGLGALTVLSLLWLALRRRPFGRKAGAAVRSVYAPLLGLGGWIVGALIVLTALPTVPLQDELLGSLSVGVPIGLAVYFAWVHRDWSARTKAIGFAATAGGALVGAWLGFNVTSAGFGMLAPLLAIVGAVVGANTTVLALDVAWELQAQSRSLADAPSAPPQRVAT
jgi:hypothetical protein